MSQRAWDLLVVGGVAGTGPGREQDQDTGAQQPPIRRFARGASVALAAVRLGARVTLLGRAPSGAAGRAVLDSLANAGVATRHVIDAEAHAGGLEPDDIDALAPDRAARVLVLELEVGAP